MAKKKVTPVVPDPSQVEMLNELGDTLEALSTKDTDGSRYHATFTPTWRPEIDCGEHDRLEDAQQAIIDVAAEFDVNPMLGWHRESPVLWLATGHDGQVDTMMTIAKIEQV